MSERTRLRTSPARDQTQDDAPPPILRSWRNVYAVVVLALAIQIGLYWALGRLFS